MVFKVEVYSTVPDSRAANLKQQFVSLGIAGNITSVTLADAYTIEKELTTAQLEAISDMLVNPVTQVAVFYSDAKPKPPFFTAPACWVIETGYLPGVTDNVATTTKEGIADLLKMDFTDREGVYTTQIIFIEGDLSPADSKKIADSLINPIIQRIHVKSGEQFKKDGGMDVIVPQVKLTQSPEVKKIDLEVDDEALAIIGKAGIANDDGTRRGPLALDLSYMSAIQTYFRDQKRAPTDLELESIAQTWSEHCKHTIFADPLDDIKEGLYKSLIKAATNEVRRKKGKKDICVSVFTDNSGGIVFDDDYVVTHKAETHNTPSALDPFGGAVTGIVGVNRDAIGFGMGALPVINTFGFCFADPNDETPLYRDEKRTQKMLSPRRIMNGVVAGVNAGGNCSGIPTPQGFMCFDQRYKGKPLVFVGTVGLIPRKINNRPSHEKAARPGDYIVMVGGRVGLDGIHGATFSSEALDSGSPVTAVQIGDPITQKKLSDALVKEARDQGLYHSITDNGAGGLSCSVAEMAKESGGCLVKLDAVPVKYPGLEPWQIWISESQERMTLSVPPASWSEFHMLMQRRGVEATVIGEFTDTGRCVVTYGSETVMDIEMDFLHDGLPVRPLTSTYTAPQLSDPRPLADGDLTEALLTLLARPNIASFAFLNEQYDHEVMGGSVLKPLQGRGRVNAEASVTRPVLTSDKGVALSQGIIPSYSDLDTYHMAAAAIDTAVRNLVAIGADPDSIALLDNFCWCSSNEPERLGQLKRAVQACYDYAVAYETPFISGKDSMFNDFKGFDEQGSPLKVSIPPTLLISSIAVMDDAEKAVSLDVKIPGDLIYLLGETTAELGGSEYFAWLSEQQNSSATGTTVPQVDATRNRNLYHDFHQCVQEGIVASALAVNKGGLAVAISKTLMGGCLGAQINISSIAGETRNDQEALFSESQGRLLVTVARANQPKFESILKDQPYTCIGTVTYDDTITVTGQKDAVIIATTVGRLLESYRSTFKGY